MIITKKFIQNIVSLLAGLMFINAGLNKIFNYFPVPQNLPDQLVQMNTAMAEIGWLLPLVAIAEITGGVLFIIPRFRALGAIILFSVMMGIMIIHFTVAPSGLAIAAAIFLILLWGMYENRDKYLQLVSANNPKATVGL